jgi:hypothetical protein
MVLRLLFAQIGGPCPPYFLSFVVTATPSSGIEIRQRMLIQDSADVVGDHRQMQLASAFRAVHWTLRWQYRSQQYLNCSIVAMSPTDHVVSERIPGKQRRQLAEFHAG